MYILLIIAGFIYHLAFPIAFLGAIFFSIKQFIHVELLSSIFSSSGVIFINGLIAVAGPLSLLAWFHYSVNLFDSYPYISYDEFNKVTTNTTNVASQSSGKPSQLSSIIQPSSIVTQIDNALSAITPSPSPSSTLTVPTDSSINNPSLISNSINNAHNNIGGI